MTDVVAEEPSPKRQRVERSSVTFSEEVEVNEEASGTEAKSQNEEAESKKSEDKDESSNNASISRDEIAKNAEDRGEIHFRLVYNDRKPESMLLLLQLKSIFSRQLPKMPREYICRLVMDRKHQSICCVKNGNAIGGICFRPFYDQGFAEIAFCAVKGEEQVRGIGTRLMNHLKFHCASERIFHFLTYADNFAVGYFQKQGFSKNIRMPDVYWREFIKHYDGGTLVECVIRPTIDYRNIPTMIKQQRQAVYEKIKRVTRDTNPVAYDDMEKAVEQICADSKRSEEELNDLHSKMRIVFDELFDEERSWPFREAVSKEDAPDYYDIIKNPIDLSIIRERIESGTYYVKWEQFSGDVTRMFENCQKYNQDSSIFFQLATDLLAWFRGRCLEVFGRPSSPRKRAFSSPVKR